MTQRTKDELIQFSIKADDAYMAVVTQVPADSPELAELQLIAQAAANCAARAGAAPADFKAARQ